MCDVTPSSHVVPEAHRALELLEDYHEKLTKPQDKQLRLAIERVIRIFKSRLFQALLGEYTHYHRPDTYVLFKHCPTAEGVADCCLI